MNRKPMKAKQVKSQSSQSCQSCRSSQSNDRLKLSYLNYLKMLYLKMQNKMKSLKYLTRHLKIIMTILIIIIFLAMTIQAAEAQRKTDIPSADPKNEGTDQETETTAQELQEETTQQTIQETENQEINSTQSYNAEEGEGYPEGENQKTEPSPDLAHLQLTDITPKTTIKGDVLLNLNIENWGSAEATDVTTEIVGAGFTSYDSTTIKRLMPGESTIVVVAGRFKESGDVLLTIKTGNQAIGTRRFYETIQVTEPTSADKARLQQENTERLEWLNSEIKGLIKNYDLLGEQIYRKSKTHDVSKISLDDMRRYMINAESAIATGDPDKANLNIVMAQREYGAQSELLEKAPEASFVSRYKDYIVLSSATIAIMTFLVGAGRHFKAKLSSTRQKLTESKKTKRNKK